MFHHRSPAVMDLVADIFLSAGRNLNEEFDRAAVEFFERIGIFEHVPVRPSIEVLNDSYFDRFSLMVADLGFERFVKPSGIEICAVFGASALTGHIEGVAGMEANSFISWSVVDVVFAGEFELAIIVASIKTDASFGKRHSEMILRTVFEFLHDPNFGIGEDAVAFLLADALHRPILVILVELKAIVDINGFGLDAGGADHFHLFGFAVVESRGMFERIKMIFVEGLFGD